MNKQPTEKRQPSYHGQVDVHSIFHTIQGEGPFCGTPAVFIRLAGCNLQCPGCDTDYTSDRKLLGPYEILFEVNELMRRDRWARGLVVITGGEPFRQHIGELIHTLIDSGYYVQVESNGTMNPPCAPWSQRTDERHGAYLVISPKTGKLNPLALEAACALKYVVEAGDVREEDGLPLTALRHSANPFPARPPSDWGRLVYVQPMDSKDDEKNRLNIQAAVRSCMEHGYILQLQVHKIIGVD